MPVSGVDQPAIVVSVTALKKTHKGESLLSTKVIAVENTPRTYWLQREKNDGQLQVRETGYNSRQKRYGRDDLYLRLPAGQSIDALSQSEVKIVSKDTRQTGKGFHVISVQRNGAQELQFSVPVQISKQQLDDFLAASTERMKNGTTQDVQLDALLAAKTVATLETHPEKFSEKFTALELQTINVRYKRLLDTGRTLLREHWQG